MAVLFLWLVPAHPFDMFKWLWYNEYMSMYSYIGKTRD